MTSYTPEQIECGRKLKRWFMQSGIPDEQKAKLEVAQVLKRYPLKKIKQAMNSTSCTSVSNFKKILIGKEAFKKELDS